MHWIRFEHSGRTGFGELRDAVIHVHTGDLFAGSQPSGETLALADVTVLIPCQPTKMIGLWNNFHALAAKLAVPEPPEPLYFLKAPNSYHPHGKPIRAPQSYQGKVVYEGELGVVIGKTCRSASEVEAAAAIFGYTCVNDVTAMEIINKDTTFAQWTRAKSFDTFGVFGPAIATGLDPAKLTVRTLLNGRERQNYPASDMIFSPVQIVSLLSQDLTLEPGDVICCGTSIGVLPMKAGSTIEIVIDGIGTLSNQYQ